MNARLMLNLFGYKTDVIEVIYPIKMLVTEEPRSYGPWGHNNLVIIAGSPLFSLVKDTTLLTLKRKRLLWRGTR